MRQKTPQSTPRKAKQPRIDLPRLTKDAIEDLKSWQEEYRQNAQTALQNLGEEFLQEIVQTYNELKRMGRPEVEGFSELLQATMRSQDASTVKAVRNKGLSLFYTVRGLK